MSHNIKAIAEQLRTQGYRVTPQRQLILDAVCALGGHVTPEAVYEQVQRITPTLNRSTVYRTLEFLDEQQILNLAHLPDGHLGYELASPQPHHHLVCRTCHATSEIPHTVVQPLFQQIQQEFDFKIDMVHLSLWGECAHCRAAKTEYIPHSVGIAQSGLPNPRPPTGFGNPARAIPRQAGYTPKTTT